MSAAELAEAVRELRDDMRHNADEVAVLDRVLIALSTPPADDMHANNVSELLGEARELVASWDLRGSWTSESPIGLVARMADALEVAAVRPRGTVTDAERYAAALRAIADGDGPEFVLEFARDSLAFAEAELERAHRALEAAREFRP